MSQNLLQWTVADVASYFSAAGFPEQAVAFRTQVSAPPQKCPRGRYTDTANVSQSSLKLFLCIQLCVKLFVGFLCFPDHWDFDATLSFYTVCPCGQLVYITLVLLRAIRHLEPY